MKPGDELFLLCVVENNADNSTLGVEVKTNETKHGRLAQRGPLVVQEGGALSIAFIMKEVATGRRFPLCSPPPCSGRPRRSAVRGWEGEEGALARCGGSAELGTGGSERETREALAVEVERLQKAYPTMQVVCLP